MKTPITPDAILDLTRSMPRIERQDVKVSPDLLEYLKRYASPGPFPTGFDIFGMDVYVDDTLPPGTFKLVPRRALGGEGEPTP